MSGKTTKADLIDALSGKTGLQLKAIHQGIDVLFELIKEGLLAGKTIELRGFGTFEIRQRKGKLHARNPKTGKILSVEDHGVVFFRPGRDLKKEAWGILRDTKRKTRNERI